MGNTMRKPMSHRRQKSCRKGKKLVPSTAQEAVDRMRDAVIFAAGPRQWDDTREQWLARAALRLHIPFQRAWKIFYKRVTNPSAAEFIEITRRHAELCGRRESQEAAHVAHQIAISALAGQASAGDQSVGAAAQGKTDGDMEQAP